MFWVHETVVSSYAKGFTCFFFFFFFLVLACKRDLLTSINLPGKKQNKEALHILKFFKISNFPVDIYPSHIGRKNCPAGREIMFPTWLNWPNDFLSPFSLLKHLIAKAHIHYIDVFFVSSKVTNKTGRQKSMTCLSCTSSTNILPTQCLKVRW